MAVWVSCFWRDHNTGRRVWGELDRKTWEKPEGRRWAFIKETKGKKENSTEKGDVLKAFIAILFPLELPLFLGTG